MKNKQTSHARELQKNDTDNPASGGGAQPPLCKWLSTVLSFQRGWKWGWAWMYLIVENWTSTASARWSSSPPPGTNHVDSKDPCFG